MAHLLDGRDLVGAGLYHEVVFGVPVEHRAALQELRRRYSTRPGAPDAALVTELGLFDYLAGRLAICGTPDECLAQVRAARAAGVRRLMFSVSLAVDPVATVRLFGEKVLPALREPSVRP